ncbi:MAG: DUF3592 domain-containing protein [Clostridia bacterium]|nr:DUF3592 domain-containing protein [Clostridia bacterium]
MNNNNQFDQNENTVFQSNDDYQTKVSKIMEEYNIQNGHSYRMGKDIDFSTLKMLYPDAGRSTYRDGLPKFFLLTILGAVSILIVIVFLIVSIMAAENSKKFIDNAVTVTGQVTNVTKHRNKKSVRYTYVVRYSYEYAGDSFNGQDTLDFSDASRMGLTSIVNSGRSVTVYIDPDNPSSSMLVEEKADSAFSAFLVLGAMGVFLIVVGVKHLKDCEAGKRAVYTVSGKKKSRKIS